MMFCAATSPIILHHRPRNRNTYITITKEGEVCVRTPIKNETALRKLLASKAGWISAKLQGIREASDRRHEPGKTIRFRGENYPVSGIASLQNHLQKAKNGIDIEKYYHRFYREEAELTLPSRIEYYARKMGLHPSSVRFKKMRRRWGSCDARGIVTFNTLMMQLSYEHIDYIIVHELAHLRHMNHSGEFHALVRVFLPEEKWLRKELRGITPL